MMFNAQYGQSKAVAIFGKVRAEAAARLANADATAACKEWIDVERRLSLRDRAFWYPGDLAVRDVLRREVAPRLGISDFERYITRWQPELLAP